jgi:hypothetical protein
MTQEIKASPLTTPFAALFGLGALGLIGFAIVDTDTFLSWTKIEPFQMGFAKLFLLGTVGELLKMKIVKGTWALTHIFERAFVWGVFGLWFTLAFPAFAGVVATLIGKGLWPGSVPPAEGADLGVRLWFAFSCSLWINILGMYALGMMVGHEYFNHLIACRWRTWSTYAFAEGADKKFLLGFLPKTLIFWVPAHTLTYYLDPEWRVFSAAILAVVLGFLLSVGRRTSKA